MKKYELKRIAIWGLLSTVLLVLAAVLTFPGSLEFSRSMELASIASGDGFLLSAEMPQGAPALRNRTFLFPDAPVISENGQALEHPGSSLQKIVNAGRGRYECKGSKIRFSTSDSQSPSGRKYMIRMPIWSLHEFLILPIWFLGLMASAVTVRLLFPIEAPNLMFNRTGGFVALVLSLSLLAIFFQFRSLLSDRFFLGLFFPTLWAMAVGVCVLQKHAAGRVGLFILAGIPACAGYFYYGLNAASDDSFLVAGIIPCSDAWIHFLQSAEIALSGQTHYLFNGRFFYPVFYAVLLKVAGLNVLNANLLVSLLVMFALASTCPLVARRVGGMGTALYCLLLWLYFRAHGCGLLMSENLGLLLGVLGLGLLLYAVDRDKIWVLFVSLILFGLGSAARPGALFILPALVVYIGIYVWKTRVHRWRIVRSVGAALFALILVVGCFQSNHLFLKTFFHGEGKPFGNFAFTLHGLLNETKWSTSYEASDGNASLVMEQNIKQLKESPGSLIRGMRRAYGAALKSRFLFRFGDEKRLAASGFALSCLAVMACWCWKPLHRDFGWIFLTVAGIIASIPFAPPWDAGGRPYAATEPIQIFLVAAGFSLMINLLRQLAIQLTRGGSMALCHGPAEGAGNLPTGRALFVLSALACLLLLFAPLFLKTAHASQFASSQIPAFLPGSCRLVAQEESTRANDIARSNYLSRLSNFEAHYPERAHFFSSQPADFLLAINWQTLQSVLISPPPTDTTCYK